MRACDPDNSYAGITLFAPQSGGGKVYFIDLDGKILHMWIVKIILASLIIFLLHTSTHAAEKIRISPFWRFGPGPTRS